MRIDDPIKHRDATGRLLVHYSVKGSGWPRFHLLAAAILFAFLRQNLKERQNDQQSRDNRKNANLQGLASKAVGKLLNRVIWGIQYASLLQKASG